MGRDRHDKKRERGPGPDASALSGARPGRLPEKPGVRLATLVGEPPAGDGWLHEIKFDGYRIVARVEKGKARLISRNGKDWTARFRRVADAVGDLAADDAVVDGEVVVLDEKGVSRFQALQNSAGDGDADLRYFVFDLLHLDGHDLTRVPIEERKEALRALLAASAPLDRVVYSDHVRGGGEAFFRSACDSGVEGIISKRAGSKYGAGRSRDWLKTKCVFRQEFVIVGYTEPSGSRVGFGALLLGVQDPDGELVFAGKVGTGFTDDLLRELHRKLKRIERKTSPLADPPKGAAVRDVHWVTPKMVGEVEFTEWTGDGKIRHPSFKGLRLDKPAEDVVREEPRPATEPAPKKESSGGKARDPDQVAGVRLTSSDRVLWPDTGVTKLDLADYWARVADRALPYLAERPLTLVRCPSGIGGECFYQKHARESMPDTIPRIRIDEEDDEEPYLMVDGLPAIVSLVQMSVLELHVWGSRAGDLDRPERLVFDLDPGPGVVWPRVALAAVDLRDRLAGAGLRSFLLATGGKGLHVVAPLVPRADWDEAKAYARELAETMADEASDELTSKMPKKYRKGRIFVDYLRNDRNATAIAPWSSRAREGAPVAMPMGWDELAEHNETPRWTVRNAAERLKGDDPWDGYEKARKANEGAL